MKDLHKGEKRGILHWGKGVEGPSRGEALAQVREALVALSHPRILSRNNLFHEMSN